MPTFYADEDLPGPLVITLRARGYDILTVQQDGRAGAGDPAVLARAVELGRAVLTKNQKTSTASMPPHRHTPASSLLPMITTAPPSPTVFTPPFPPTPTSPASSSGS